MKVISTVLILVLSFVGAQAAVKKTSPKNTRHYLERTIRALHMEHDQGMADLVKQGHWGYRNLAFLAFDPKQKMQLRWRALTRMAKIGRNNAIPELERAARSDDWFMRAASLVAFRRVSHKHAVEWGRKFIDDPSLVVRAEAVTTISRTLDKGAKPLLLKELYHRRNFRDGKSIWLRKKIAESYANLSDLSDIKILMQIMNDRDVTLKKPAIRGLERVTKNKFGEEGEDLKLKAQYWKNWYAKNKSMMNN